MMTDHWMLAEDLRRTEHDLAVAKHVGPALVLTDNWREAQPLTVYPGAARVGTTITVRLPQRWRR